MREKERAAYAARSQSVDHPGSPEKTGGKIATKETQEGCLSFLINRFSELFRVLKNASSLSERLFDKLERAAYAARSQLIGKAGLCLTHRPAFLTGGRLPLPQRNDNLSQILFEGIRIFAAAAVCAAI